MATLNELFIGEDMRPIIIFQTDGDEAYFLRNPAVQMSVPEGLDGAALQSAQSAIEFHRHIVGYYPTNKERDGKRRKIDFQVKGHPEYQVLGRRSYFAPKP